MGPPSITTLLAASKASTKSTPRAKETLLDRAAGRHSATATNATTYGSAGKRISRLVAIAAPDRNDHRLAPRAGSSALSSHQQLARIGTWHTASSNWCTDVAGSR